MLWTTVVTAGAGSGFGCSGFGGSGAGVGVSANFLLRKLSTIAAICSRLGFEAGLAAGGVSPV